MYESPSRSSKKIVTPYERWKMYVRSSATRHPAFFKLVQLTSERGDSSHRRALGSPDFDSSPVNVTLHHVFAFQLHAQNVMLIAPTYSHDVVLSLPLTPMIEYELFRVTAPISAFVFTMCIAAPVSKITPFVLPSVMTDFALTVKRESSLL